MTTIEMQTRVMVQLRSYHREAERTADEIARAMVSTPPELVTATLRLMERSQPQPLVTRVPQKRGPDKWRVA